MTRRPWTKEDQACAEGLKAQGLSYQKIGDQLGRCAPVIWRRLNPAAASQLRDKEREANLRYYEKNRERLRESSRRYYEKNRKRVVEAKRRFNKENRERLREDGRRCYMENSEKIRERKRRWAKNNSEKVQKRNRRRYAMRRAARCRALAPATSAAVDARFALWRNCCAFCGVGANHLRNAGRKRLTEDHVLALTKSGIDEVGNIIPACSKCNSSKSTAFVETWYRRQPFFTEARWRKIQRHCPGAAAGQLPLAMPPNPSLSAPASSTLFSEAAE